MCFRSKCNQYNEHIAGQVAKFEMVFPLRPSNNYVDKIRGGGWVKKMPVFVHAQGIKTVQAVVEWTLLINPIKQSC